MVSVTEPGEVDGMASAPHSNGYLRDQPRRTLQEIAQISGAIERARGFETFVSGLIEGTPGLSVQGSELSALDVDVVAWNDSAAPELRMLANPLFIECKWRSHPLDRSEIEQFALKLRQRALGSGVLITSEFLTHEAEEAVRSLQQQGLRLIALNRADLDAIAAGEMLTGRIALKLRDLLLPA
jgi:hypothetical protein